MKLTLRDFPILFWKHNPDDEVSLVVNGDVIGVLLVADLMSADILDADERVRALRLEIQQAARRLASKVDALSEELEEMREHASSQKRKVSA